MNDDVTRLQERLIEGFVSLSRRIPAVLDDPRGHPQEALALAAIIAVALLLVVLVVVLVLDAAQSAQSRRTLGVHRRGHRRLALFAALATAAGVLIVAVGLSPLLPPMGGACGTCHAPREAVASWRAGPHVTASCYSCHAPAGIMGALEASADGVSGLLSADRSPSARSDSCVRCHEVMLQQTLTVGGIKVRHAEIHAAGMECLACHPGVGHRSANGGASSSRQVSARSRMADCLPCHDGKTAPSECETCHVGSMVDLASSDVTPRDIEKTPGCGGCHAAETEAECIECHGLELPHPTGFLREHAALSFNEPALCAKCHVSATDRAACSCHSEPGDTHGDLSTWFALHGESAAAMWPGGCRCHEANRCLLCHDELPSGP